MVALYLDTGDLTLMSVWAQEVEGITTNPSLMKAAGVKNYLEFAKRALDIAEDRPISFEVFPSTAHLDTLEAQAYRLHELGKNVYVKIPVTHTRLIRKLSFLGVKVNVTAILAFEQIGLAIGNLHKAAPSIASIFCGRIADTGRDPTALIATALRARQGATQVLWASTREVLNIYQAEACGADVITVSPAILAKYLEMKDKDLNELSLQTIKQFDEDSKGIVF